MELLKSRSFGNRLSDTFAFLQQNFKPLLRGLFTITFPALIIYALVSYMFFNGYFHFYGNMFQNAMYGGNGNINTLNPYEGLSFMLWALLLLLITLVVTVLICSVTYSYIKLYKENKEQVITTSMLWQLVKNYFWKLTGGYLLYGLIVYAAMFVIIMVMALFSFVIGDMLIYGTGLTPALFFFLILAGVAAVCVIVYVLVKFCFFSLFIIIEDTKATRSLSESFKFTKGIFWKTLGFSIVVGLIVNTVTGIFQLPGIIPMYAGVFFKTNAFMLNLSTVLLSIGSTIGVIVTAVSIVATAIFYFSEIEERYGIMADKEIDEIGKRE